MDRKVIIKKIESAESYIRLCEYRKSLNVLKKIELNSDPNIKARVFRLMSLCESELGDIKSAEYFGQMALGILETSGNRGELALLFRTLGRLYIRKGMLKKAEEYLQDALSLFRQLKDKFNIARVYNLLAHTYYIGGKWNFALKTLEDSLSFARQWKMKEMVPPIAGNLGLVNLRIGNWNEAKRYYDEVSIYLHKVKPIQKAKILQSMGLFYMHRREWNKAESLFRKALRISEEVGYLREICISYEFLGELYYEKGKLDEAEGYYNKVLALIQDKLPEGDFINQVERRRAEILIEKEKLSEAIQAIRKAIRVSKKLGDIFELAVSMRVLGTIHRKKGRKKKGIEYIKKSIELLSNLGEKFERAKSHKILGEILLQDRESALEHLLRAEELFDSIPSHHWSSLTKLNIAELKFSYGKTEEALVILNKLLMTHKGNVEGRIIDYAIELKKRYEETLVDSVINESNRLSEITHLNSATIDPSGILQDTVRKLEITRGFIASREGIKCSYGIDCERAEFIFKDLSTTEEKPPLLYSSDGKYAVVTIGNNSEGSILYVERENSPLTQRDLVYLRMVAGILEGKASTLASNKISSDTPTVVLKGHRMEPVIARSENMKHILNIISQIKDSTIPILIQGETGCGKEILARLIHQTSRRKDYPFVSINCANIQESLLEAELFGYEKGAFTDAKTDKKGWFEVAEGGTVFLDEVAELNWAVQSKFLRFLETGEITPLGSRKIKIVDVRVLAATHRNLYNEVKCQRFREDLYYRLKGVLIKILPLRERREDILPLAEYFLNKYREETNKEVKGFDKEVIDIFMEYAWHGNVRELENEVQRAVVLAQPGGWITREHLSMGTSPSFDYNLDEKAPHIQKNRSNLKKYMEYIEKELILQAMESANGVKAKAAKLLGIPEGTLRTKLKRYRI